MKIVQVDTGEKVCILRIVPLRKENPSGTQLVQCSLDRNEYTDLLIIHDTNAITLIENPKIPYSYSSIDVMKKTLEDRGYKVEKIE